MELDVDITRRQALAGGGVLVGVGALLGISHVLRGPAFVEPTVPEETLRNDGWTRVDETREVVLEDSAGPLAVQANAVTVRWEDGALVEKIRDAEVTVEAFGLTRTQPLGNLVGSEFGGSMGAFAATKIDVTPHVDELPGGLGRAEVMNPVRTQARESFEEQLREAGLEDVSRAGTRTLEIDTGETADVFEYDATFPFEATTVDVDGGSVRIPSTGIDVAGYLAVWHDGVNVLIAAGAHPDENHADTVTDTVRGETVTVSFDLGLRPARMREDLLGYMAAVE